MRLDSIELNIAFNYPWLCWRQVLAVPIGNALYISVDLLARVVDE